MKQFACILISFLVFASAIAKDYVPVSFRLLHVETSVDWDEYSFNDFVEWMRHDVGWNIIVRWDALSAQGVDKESSISIKLQDAPVAVIVNEIFEQVSPDITYHFTEHSMIISSRDDFNKDLFARAYHIADLILPFSPMDDPPSVGLPATSQSVPSSIFGDVSPADKPDSLMEIKIQIENAIKGIQPNTWDCAGGNGTISWLGETVVVRNIIEVHELIAGSFHG